MTDRLTVSAVIDDVNKCLGDATAKDVHEKFAVAVRRLLIKKAWAEAPETLLFSNDQFTELKTCVYAEGASELSHHNRDLLERVLLYRSRPQIRPTEVNSGGNDNEQHEQETPVIVLRIDKVKDWFKDSFQQDQWRIPSQPTAEELRITAMEPRELSEKFKKTLEEAQEQYKALQDLHQQGLSAIEKSLTKLDDNILHRRKIPPIERGFWSRIWDL
jgi:hypothetical protein